MAQVAGSGQGKWTVFASASLALILSTLLAVMFGGLISRYVPERCVKLGAGALFILFGLLLLIEGFRSKESKPLANQIPAVARTVLKRAIAFEEASMTDYQRLAAQTENPALRAVLADIALDEAQHLQMLNDIPVLEDDEAMPATKLSADVDLQHDVPVGDRDILQHAIEHEQATAQFYRSLAEHISVDEVRQKLNDLADQEEQHEARLRSFLT